MTPDGAERLLDGRFADRPGWTMDRYGAVALIQSFARGGAEPSERDRLIAEAMDHPHVRGVVLKQRGTRERDAGEGELVAGTLPPPAPDDPFRDRPGRFVVTEDGARLGVDLLYGVNTGLFLDAAPMRAWLRARSDGARVLNLFSYTAAFGVAAARGGARSTTNVDGVPSALERGAANYALNRLPDDARTHTRSDVFAFLGRAAKRGTTWDVVVSDPPPVPTLGGRGGGRRKGFDPIRDTERLLRLALRCVTPGGALLAMSAARGEERFEGPLAAVTAELWGAAEALPLDRAPEFPGPRGDGLRGFWVVRPE